MNDVKTIYLSDQERAVSWSDATCLPGCCLPEQCLSQRCNQGISHTNVGCKLLHNRKTCTWACFSLKTTSAGFKSSTLPQPPPLPRDLSLPALFAHITCPPTLSIELLMPVSYIRLGLGDYSTVCWTIIFKFLLMLVSLSLCVQCFLEGCWPHHICSSG